jgi:hypothetical protein
VESTCSIDNLTEEAQTQCSFTSVLQTALVRVLMAGLDKTQQPYNENWPYPIPPKENRLKVRIEAGEKKYHEDH